MLYEVKSWRSGRVIATQESDSLKGALELLVRSGAVLRGAVLRGAVLSDADLSDAVLSDADLRGKEFLVVPQLHTKMLEAINNGGSLDMGSWHKCETTHCRAGWAVTLAGPVGKFLEAQMGSAAAGAFITLASCPWMDKVPNFYATNEDALEDIWKCAEREREMEQCATTGEGK